MRPNFSEIKTYAEFAKYDHVSCEWNQFLKDFCADKRNLRFKNKLQAASILWNIVRNSTWPKVYSYDLVEKYQDLLHEENETTAGLNGF